MKAKAGRAVCSTDQNVNAKDGIVELFGIPRQIMGLVLDDEAICAGHQHEFHKTIEPPVIPCLVALPLTNQLVYVAATTFLLHRQP